MQKYEKGSAHDIFEKYGLTIPTHLNVIDVSTGEANQEKREYNYETYRKNDENYSFGDKVGNAHGGLLIVLDKSFVSGSSPKANFSGVVLMPYDKKIAEELNEQGYKIAYEGQIYDKVTNSFESAKGGSGNIILPGSASLLLDGSIKTSFKIEEKEYPSFDMLLRNKMVSFEKNKTSIINDMNEYKNQSQSQPE